mgnify:CR=1 FL=1
MLRNIALVCIGLVIAYVGYEIFTLYQKYNDLDNVGVEYRMGNEDADLSVVEFLDYGCPYCREVHPTIMQAVAQDGKVDYVPRPVAFLGEKSAHAAIVVYGAAQQGKFFQMHDAIIANFPDFSDEMLPKIASEAGVNMIELQQDIDTQDLQEYVISNMDLFKRLGGKATPTFIIDKRIFYVPEGNMPSVEDFLTLFAEARGLKAQESE